MTRPALLMHQDRTLLKKCSIHVYLTSFRWRRQSWSPDGRRPHHRWLSHGVRLLPTHWLTTPTTRTNPNLLGLVTLNSQLTPTTRSQPHRAGDTHRSTGRAAAPSHGPTHGMQPLPTHLLNIPGLPVPSTREQSQDRRDRDQESNVWIWVEFLDSKCGSPGLNCVTGLELICMSNVTSSVLQLIIILINALTKK
jgi:hypothetical protein